MKRLVFITVAILCLSACSKQDVKTHFISVDAVDLTANKLGVSDTGNQLLFNVSSDIYWTAEESASWLGVYPVAGYGSQTQVTITMEANDGEARDAVIILSAVDGTKTSLTVHQRGSTETVNYLTLGFENSFPTYKGIGSSPVCVEGDGYVITDGKLVFGEDAVVSVGPVQPRESQAFRMMMNVDGDGLETYVSNRKELKNKLTEEYFYFDELTSFYVCMTAPVGTVLKGITIDEGVFGQGQYIHFGDGKPEGYVYFTDDFKWLANYSDVDFIRTLDNSAEALWTKHTSKAGFNPTGWSLSDNSLKQRVYVHSNCLKFGRSANSQGSGGGVITPALGISEGYYSNVQLKVYACAFYPGVNGNFDAESAMLIRILGDGEVQDTGGSMVTIELDKSAEKKAIWDSSNIEYRVANVWEEYDVNVLGVSSSTRFAIETTAETTKGRIMIGGVSVTKIKVK